MKLDIDILTYVASRRGKTLVEHICDCISVAEQQNNEKRAAIQENEQLIDAYVGLLATLKGDKNNNG